MTHLIRLHLPHRLPFVIGYRTVVEGYDAIKTTDKAWQAGVLTWPECEMICASIVGQVEQMKARASPAPR